MQNCKAYFYKFYSQRLLLQATHFAKPQLQKAGNTRERAHSYKMHSCKQDTNQNEGYQKLTFWGHLHRTHFCMTQVQGSVIFFKKGADLEMFFEKLILT